MSESRLARIHAALAEPRVLVRRGEERTLTRANVPAGMLPYSRSARLDVNTSNALRVADAYAAVRCLADSISSLPLKVFRKTPAGRIPAGDDSRAVQLLDHHHRVQRARTSSRK